jgi:hypothetical protein
MGQMEGKEQAVGATTDTTITVGNGAKTKFWHDRWLHNQRPIELAPALYCLPWRKNIMVNRAMVQGNWMKGLHRISTTGRNPMIRGNMATTTSFRPIRS